MSILGRLFGFAAVGPIGAMGPTEASKRSKKQLAEMQKQTALLESQNKALGVTPRPAGAGVESWSPLTKVLAGFGVLIFLVWPLAIGSQTNADGTTDPSLTGYILLIVWVPIGIWLLRQFYMKKLSPTSVTRPSTPHTAVSRPSTAPAAPNVGDASVGAEAPGLVSPPSRLHDDSKGDTDSPEDQSVAAGLDGEPSTPFKTCPDCAEEVRYAARKCRFCGYVFESDGRVDGA